MPPQTEQGFAVKALAGAIQEKLVLPAEQRFTQMEARINRLERRLRFYGGSLAAGVLLAFALAVYCFLR